MRSNLADPGLALRSPAIDDIGSFSLPRKWGELKLAAS